MKKAVILLFVFGFPFLILAQSNLEVLVINLEDSIAIPDSNFIQEIRIKRKLLKRTLPQLKEQVADSARLYKGNCLQITYHDKSKTTTIENRQFPDYIRAKIYAIDMAEKIRLTKIVEQNEIRRDSLIRHRPTSKDFEISLGFQTSQFTLKDNPGFILRNNSPYNGSLNFFFHLNRVFKPQKNKQLNYRIGVGAAREYLGFYSLVTLEEAGIANTDTIRIGEVENWEYQLLIPLSISYEFPNLIKKGSGVRFFLGFENRIRLHRIATEATLVTNYDFQANIGDYHEDEILMQKTNDLFSNFINPYSLQINLGIGFLQPELGSAGIKVTNMLIPSFGNGQKFTRQVGFLFFLELPLFNRKKL
jgi:hypothetical protein